MPCDPALRRWLAPSSMALALLATSCAALQNTPAQDLAWTRFSACRNQVIGPDIKSVQTDGQILFWSNGSDDGMSMLDCLAEAGKNGPALPQARYDIRPKGGG